MTAKKEEDNGEVVYFDRRNIAISKGPEVSTGPPQKVVGLRANGGFRVQFQDVRVRRRNFYLLGAVNV